MMLGSPIILWPHFTNPIAGTHACEIEGARVLVVRIRLS